MGPDMYGLCGETRTFPLEIRRTGRKKPLYAKEQNGSCCYVESLYPSRNLGGSGARNFEIATRWALTLCTSESRPVTVLGADKIMFNRVH